MEGGVHKVMELCFDPNNVVLVYGKRRLRRLFWRVRAHIRRQIKSHNKLHNQRFSFSYDPFTYSLNFDNGNFGFFC
ncbi:hypothetical protein TIFTF001_021791 [Ficus carica]|uniref:Uncharacterized protein n=1 Tax=Ficus carica TaxID=3494 RepID=A0AA88ASZ1_FICCA|nr:hypothetical protein TIFTF001_021791 [Ficus carica]